MSTGLLFNNLVSYSLQIGMLVGLAGFVPSLLRLRQPGARLVYWYILLAACLALPLAQPWKPAILAGTVEVTTVVTAVRTSAPVSHFSIPPAVVALLLLAAGVLFRLLFLAVGFWKLRRYCRHALPLDPAPSWGAEASLRVSADVPGPVTFGWRKPVVLLPKAFPNLDPRVQDAILCHEILHVRRGDWLFTLAEELVRAAFWFHPAIWWLLGEIGLAREQEVDRQAIGITRQRDEYMDALLAIAGSHAGLDLAPAPLFLRKRHLKQRVVLILSEVRMSNTRLISALTASVVALAAACWLVTGTFPLMAAPQVVNDAPGITVGLSGASLLHRAPVEYPVAAMRAGIQGTLSIEVRTDAKGNVTDAHVLSGPDELRKAVLQSVLQWHFAADSANTTRVVQITFENPGGVEGGIGSAPASVERVVPGVVGGVPGGVTGGVVSGVVRGTIGSVPAGSPPPPPPPSVEEFVNRARQSTFDPAAPLTIKSILVLGLSDQAKNELLGRLPVREGDILTGDRSKIIQAAHDYDEHLSMRFQTDNASGASIIISVPSVDQSAPQRIKVGGNVQSVMVLSKVQPVYPALAKSAQVQGVVHLAVIIAKDGTVQEIKSLGGPALLIAAAMDAVKQWIYRPTLLNGEPVQVETTVDINFTLAQ